MSTRKCCGYGKTEKRKNKTLSTLYIRLPSHAVAESLEPGMPLYCPFATATGGAIEREGVAALPDMAELVGKSQRVVLLLAAGDVTLLRLKVPPLSSARLKAALPNLVEDRLMSDPEECVVVADNTRNEMRTVAVVQRNWLELLARTLLSLGARAVSAMPSQLCLPQQPEIVSAAVAENGSDIDLAVRLGEHEGIGLSIVAEQAEAAAFEVLQSLAAVVPHGAITLYVPQGRVRDYQESLHIAPPLEQRITLHADNWQRWIDGADRSALDLMSGLGAAAAPKIDWARWRLPLALAAALLAVNVIGLNIDWLRLKREAEALRLGMIQSYKSAFPKETVIVDPVAQLRQKLASGQRDAGQLAPDDFVALAAAFGEAWSGSGQGAGAITALEYRDRSLTVKLKPGSNVPLEQLNTALAARNLSATQPNAGVVQIRSGR
jgi:general secretion pathway protein L